MADVIAVPGLGEQLRLIGRLRWWLFRNGLRARSEKIGLVGSVILGLFMAGFTLGIGAGIGFGSFTVAQQGKVGWFSAIFWAIFLLWHVFPVFMMDFGGTFDSRSLLRFPLRLSAYGALNLAQGLADPFGIAGIFWHGCLWLGVILARPDAWVDTTIVVGLSVTMNLLFGRMAAAWTERLLGQRRTREIAVALFILLMVSLQFVRFAVQTAAGPVAAFFHRTSALWEILPPGQAGAALRDGLTGGGNAMLLEWCGLAAYATIFAALLFQRLRAELLGEFFSETAAPTRVHRRVTPVPEAAGWRPGWLSGPVSAVFLKEIRYLSRNTILAINLLIPLVIAGAFSLNQGPRRPGMYGNFGGYMYAMVVMYATSLLMTAFSMNSLGFDGGGIQLLFLAPVPFRSVMLGKNLFQGALVAVEALLAWLLMALIGRPPPPLVLVVTWTGLVCLALLGMALGNWLSLQFPQKLAVGVRTRSAWGTSGRLLFMLAFAGCVGLLAAIGAVVKSLTGLWLVPVVFAGLDVAALFVYDAALEMTTWQATAQQEEIIEKLVR